MDRGLLRSPRYRVGPGLGDGRRHRRRSSYPGRMHTSEEDLAGRAELRAWQDDDRSGGHVRLLLNAYHRDDWPAVRAQATRLLAEVPPDFSATRNLLRRLRDIGK
jgi:hypothetical protein